MRRKNGAHATATLMIAPASRNSSNLKTVRRFIDIRIRNATPNDHCMNAKHAVISVLNCTVEPSQNSLHAPDPFCAL